VRLFDVHHWEFAMLIKKRPVSPMSYSTFAEAVAGHPIRTFLICLIGMTLSTMDQALFSYAIPGLTAEFNVGLDVAGAMLSLSFLVASFTVVITGIMTDYFGRRRMFVITMALSALFVGCHALAPTIQWLTVFRVLGFATAVGMFPVAATMMVEAAPARYRGTLSAWLQMSYPLGFAIGALIASLFLADLGWRAMFYPAFLVIPVAFLLGAGLKETERFANARKQPTETLTPSAPVPAKRRPLTAHIAELLSPQLRRRSLICFLGTIASNIAIAGVTYFLPTFLIQDRGISQADAAGMLAWSWAIAAIGYLLASYVGEFVLTRRNTVILYQWLGAACFALTLWLAESTTVLMLGIGVSTMFFFGSESMRMPMVAEIFPTRLRATAAAVVGSLGVTIASLTAPLLIPPTALALGWTWTFTIFAVAPLVIAGFIFACLENFPAGVEIEELSV
jgi:MFS family permease